MTVENTEKYVLNLAVKYILYFTAKKTKKDPPKTINTNVLNSC